ncbi:MAG: HDOD domain-containing protein [Planctomycetes bacterium]|nr:HDOD domain-containing protein [Planctomycetota bacterium]
MTIASPDYRHDALSNAFGIRPDPRWFEKPEFQTGKIELPGEHDLGSQARLLQQILARRRVDAALELPAFPQPIIQLIELLKNPNVDTAKIARCLKTDPVVAAEVLRFANSALYAPQERIIDLRHAIAFLGFRRLHALALGIATKVTSGNIVHPRLNDQLWIHSVGVGVLSMLIARELHLDQEAAFLGGLLHDVGKIAVASELTRLNKKLILNISERETLALLEVNHSEMGRSLATHWHLPDVVHSVVSFHHEGDPPEKDRLVVAAVDAADKICYAMGIGMHAAPFAVLELKAFETLGLDHSQAAEIVEAVTSKMYGEVADLS